MRSFPSSEIFEKSKSQTFSTLAPARTKTSDPGIVPIKVAQKYPDHFTLKNHEI
jgi:hypothetical protein